MHPLGCICATTSFQKVGYAPFAYLQLSIDQDERLLLGRGGYGHLIG